MSMCHRAPLLCNNYKSPVLKLGLLLVLFFKVTPREDRSSAAGTLCTKQHGRTHAHVVGGSKQLHDWPVKDELIFYRIIGQTMNLLMCNSIAINLNECPEESQLHQSGGAAAPTCWRPSSGSAHVCKSYSSYRGDWLPPLKRYYVHVSFHIFASNMFLYFNQWQIIIHYISLIWLQELEWS